MGCQIWTMCGIATRLPCQEVLVLLKTPKPVLNDVVFLYFLVVAIVTDHLEAFLLFESMLVFSLCSCSFVKNITAALSIAVITAGMFFCALAQCCHASHSSRYIDDLFACNGDE